MNILHQIGIFSLQMAVLTWHIKKLPFYFQQPSSTCQKKCVLLLTGRPCQLKIRIFMIFLVSKIRVVHKPRNKPKFRRFFCIFIPSQIFGPNSFSHPSLSQVYPPNGVTRWSSKWDFLSWRCCNSSCTLVLTKCLDRDVFLWITWERVS